MEIINETPFKMEATVDQDGRVVVRCPDFEALKRQAKIEALREVYNDGEHPDEACERIEDKLKQLLEETDGR